MLSTMGRVIVSSSTVAVTTLGLLLGLATSVGVAQDPSFHGTPVTVTSILNEPYLMEKYGHLPRNLTGYNRYEGYIVDLIHKMSQIIGFKYRLRPVKDNSYGYQLPDGSWDGMVGELLRGEVDIAAAPLYITRHRSEVVDFSRPFITVKATILVRKPPNRVDPLVQSAADLLRIPGIRYGTLNAGIIVREFKLSNDSILQTIWANMRAFNPPTFTNTNEQGIDRVRKSKGNYAFILPSSIGDYISQRPPCDTIAVDQFLMERAYGLAVKKGSALLPKINRALTLLEINGFLHKLYRKWWLDRGECNDPINTSRHVFSLNGSSVGVCEIRFPVLLVLSLVIYSSITCRYFC